MCVNYTHIFPKAWARQPSADGARVLESGSVARIYFERRELPEDLQQLFDMIWEGAPSDRPLSAAECSPPLDVVETETGIEIVVDVPGVPPEAAQIVSARNVLMIAGQKMPPACEHHEAAFHLAERSFRRFSRPVRLDAASHA